MSSARRDLQLASLVTLGFGFLTGKVIAVTWGAEGVGYQSAVVGAGSLAALLCTFAIGNVLPEMAATRPTSTSTDFGRAFWRACGVAAIPAAGLALILTAPELSRSFALTTVTLAVVLATAGSALLAFRAVALSVFGDGSVAARFQLISAAVTSLTIVSGVLFAPIHLLPLAVGSGILLGPAVSSVATLSGIRVRGPHAPVSVRGLVGHALPTYGSSLLSAGAAAVAPLIMLNLSGAEPTGMLRAVSSLGGLPAAVVVPAIALHFYPTVSQQIAAGENPTIMTRDSIDHLGGRAALAGVALAVAAPLALWAAYSASFAGAAAALALMASAGGVRAIALHGAYLLLATGRRATYLAAESCAAIVLLAGTVLAGWYGNVTAAAGTAWLSAVSYLVFLKLALRRLGTGEQNALPVPAKLVVAHLLIVLGAAGWAVLSANGFLEG